MNRRAVRGVGVVLVLVGLLLLVRTLFFAYAFTQAFPGLGVGPSFPALWPIYLVAALPLVVGVVMVLASRPTSVTPVVPTGASPGSAPTPGGAAPAPEDLREIQALEGSLGLSGRRKFVVRDTVFGLAHKYSVSDEGGTHLLTFQAKASRSIAAGLIGGPLGRSIDMVYYLEDAAGTVRGVVHKTGGPYSASFALADVQGRELFTVRQETGLVGIETAGYAPQGALLMRTRGSLLRFHFTIEGPEGAPVARLHARQLAIADTYDVEVLGSLPPLLPLVYAVILDYNLVLRSGA